MVDERPPPKMGPGRRVVYRPDHSKVGGIGGLLISDQIKDALKEPARDIAKLAAGLTPRSSDEDKVHMADSFEVDETPRIVKVGKRRNPRVSIRVVNDVRHAAIVEFGSKGNSGRRPLGTAGGIVGRFTPATPEE